MAYLWALFCCNRLVRDAALLPTRADTSPSKDELKVCSATFVQRLELSLTRLVCPGHELNAALLFVPTNLE
jgi:hypothetical protein